jgi:Mn2+/Fe2+ NRAMP family transporter
LAIAVGIVATKLDFLAGFQKYIVALCFSSTMLFHMLPTATEILTRFPMDAPMVGSLQDPLLLKTFTVILVCFVILLALQLNWLRKSSNT